eukprot:3723999-Rhodomonas_salina.1
MRRRPPLRKATGREASVRYTKGWYKYTPDSVQIRQYKTQTGTCESPPGAVQHRQYNTQRGWYKSTPGS